MSYTHTKYVTYVQLVPLLAESILDDGDVRLVIAGNITVDLDSSLSSLNPLSAPSISVYNVKIYLIANIIVLD